MRIPVVRRFCPRITSRQLSRAVAVARSVSQENHQFDCMDESFQDLVLRSEIDDHPALHIDDFSEIPIIGKVDTSGIVQQRARLRAVDGDWIVQSRKVESGYSDYCEYRLGMGRVKWLYPTNEPHDPHQVALECWQDRRVRNDLIHAVRSEGLRYIHPHVSTLYVWELASMLAHAAHVPLKVIGPTPRLSRWANNKIEFTRAAGQLLGPDKVPRTEAAWNFATLSKKVMRLAAISQRLGIKYPYGTGGSGNFLIESNQVRGLTLSEVRNCLVNRFQQYVWPEGGRLLIDVWESGVVNSPSVQTWIPPKGVGEPQIEGLFQQMVAGEQYEFIGSFPANLPPRLEQEIVDDSYLLAIMFQEMGYVGRCSFDLILLGRDIEDPDCRVEFIECNARWGGTSLPMTLMNRLGVADEGRFWCVRRVGLAGLDSLEFAGIQRYLGDLLYDRRAHFGKYILFNPARIKGQSMIDVIGIGQTQAEANQLVTGEFPALLDKIITEHRQSSESKSVSEFLLGHADFESAK